MIAMKTRLINQNNAPYRRFVQRLLIVGCCALAAAPDVLAGAREQAKRIHDRLAGVPPTEAVLLDMAADISSGNAIQAAYTAMDNEAFYSITLKNLVTPWTNRDQTVFAPLNDYTATVIGVVRDELDFRRILFDDILYVGAGSLGLPPYANDNNDHYEAFENQNISFITGLEQRQQSSVTGLPAAATSGVLTSRGGARSFFIAGTNRAMFRFTMLNHLCNDLEQVHDISLPPDRIRRDVTRSPGGDSRAFLNGCVGCHNGMDPMTQAFAYYNYIYDADSDLTGENGSIGYNDVGQTDAVTGSRVTAKYHINDANFSFGYLTPDDSWINYWRTGINSRLGWDQNLPGSGSGARSMAQELAYSQAFAQCHVTKVFRNVCLREPEDAADRSQIDAMVASFSSDTHSYNIKQVFAESADYCKGD